VVEVRRRRHGLRHFKTMTVATPTTTYTTVAADNGHKLGVWITAINAAGSSDFVPSALVGPIGI
jgi:hypothetical protein